MADLGAGTFDLSVIKVGKNIFEVVEIEGDNSLGSADVDEVLYRHFLTSIQADTGTNLESDRRAATRLRQACEELKIELSSRTEWTIELPELVEGRPIELTLTRSELERLVAPWLKQVRAICRKIREKPTRLLLIGGGAIMPAVRRCIQEVFGIEPNSDFYPRTAVARGAAIQAGIIQGAVREVLLLDVVPFSLGTKVQEDSGLLRFDPLIPKHTKIPTKETKRYTTVEDGQRSIIIDVFQGESPQPENNFKIGEFILGGIPFAKAGIPKIDITFEIDTNCLLTVTARDAGTHNQCSIAIEDSHLLTPAQAEQLQGRFRESKTHQGSLDRLYKLGSELKMRLSKLDSQELLGLSDRVRERLQYYEAHREWYRPTPADNNILFEVYQSREDMEIKTRLIVDRWDNLSRSSQKWLENYNSLDWHSVQVENQLQQLLAEGENLLKRIQETGTAFEEIATTDRRWLSIIEDLPVNPEGNASELAQHFFHISRYEEAWTHFQRINSPLSVIQVELGLEILARSRQRETYEALLLKHAEQLGVFRPDFLRPNHSLRIYAPAVVWLQVEDIEGYSASGSGFAIGDCEIASNRHVLTNEKTGKCVLPEAVRVITKSGSRAVAAIHLPASGPDDVAILRLVSDGASAPLMQMRLGFSELVEVGERLMTIGFPAPSNSGFEENLYCNTGLVNSIRQSQLCTERVLEVSIPLQGGISGAPILNELGEVVGLLTFTMQRQQTLAGGQIHIERSFYAIPVEVLRRLWLESQRLFSQDKD